MDSDKKHLQELEQAKSYGQHLTIAIVDKVHKELKQMAKDFQLTHRHDTDLHTRMSLLIEGAAMCVTACQCASEEVPWSDHYERVHSIKNILPTLNWSGRLPNTGRV